MFGPTKEQVYELCKDIHKAISDDLSAQLAQTIRTLRQELKAEFNSQETAKPPNNDGLQLIKQELKALSDSLDEGIKVDDENVKIDAENWIKHEQKHQELVTSIKQEFERLEALTKQATTVPEPEPLKLSLAQSTLLKSLKEQPDMSEAERMALLVLKPSKYYAEKRLLREKGLI